MLKRLYMWLGTQVNTPHAEFFLAACSFLESIIFPPVAPLLILFCIENKYRSYWYATIALVCSVAGGIVSYYIGFALWETLGHKIIYYITSQETFNRLCSLYQQYQTWAILFGSFSPLPYKAIGITAGFCKLSLVPFIVFSLIGRGARYYLIALVLSLWGMEVKLFIDRWFYQLVCVFSLAIAAGIGIMLKV